ncbi:MAG TPA: diguanylate cyclase [Betaproteobacteria bacterium]|nr:diguanylate cyclase [Betaproteobacteria bacterium]
MMDHDHTLGEELDFLKSLTILYVEDDKDIREQLAQFLRRRVARLLVASNGQEGLDAYREHTPAIVITDILMPVMDGLNMAEAIKKQSPNTPIIVTTAFNETDFFLRAIDMGVDKYVIKPIDTDVMLTTLLKSVRQVRAEMQLHLTATVFETASDAIVVTDTDNRIIATNPAFTKITGYTREESLGKNPRFLSSGQQGADFYQDMWALLKRTGRWTGEIWNRRKNGASFPEWLSISAVNKGWNNGRYVAVFSDISERKAAEERIRHLAHYDVLTDLPNRTLFYDRLEQALRHTQRSHRRVAVMFVDLDRFKMINDTLGHGVGDQLLQAIGKQLKGCVRQSDTVSRQGGDEFVILLPEITHNQDAVVVAQKVLATLDRPYPIDDHVLHVTGSVGVSFYPEDGVDAETLMKNADAAMYRAKDRGRNNVQCYTPTMHTHAFQRLSLEIDMRRALETGQFILHYQPQFERPSGALTGMEALIRWRHPDLGLVPPAQFIPLAEESGLILPIGEWVLRNAIVQAQAWRQSGFDRLRISVNLSPRQFRQQDFIKKIHTLLEENHFPPHYLELELTESLLVRHTEENIEILRQLKAIGVRIAIDDFGTGYSSLSYLKRLPIDTLKIDRAFVEEITSNKDNAAIVDAIIAMAHSMSLHVIAEGVETEAQTQYLDSRHCQSVQGFYFGHPLAAEDITRLLSADTPHPLSGHYNG